MKYVMPALLSLALLATTSALTPAFAASTDAMTTVRQKGYPMKVHMMKSDDGTTIYGFTAAQMREIGFRLYDNPKSTDGSGR